MNNMDLFNYWKGGQWLGLKQLKALQTISEQFLNRSKELEYVIVKYEHGNDWTVSRKGQIFLGEL